VFVLIVWTLASGVFPETNPLGDAARTVGAVVASVLFFVSVLLHDELGHALQARRERIEIQGITLWPSAGSRRCAAARSHFARRVTVPADLSLERFIDEVVWPRRCTTYPVVERTRGRPAPVPLRRTGAAHRMGRPHRPRLHARPRAGRDTSQPRPQGMTARLFSTFLTPGAERAACSATFFSQSECTCPCSSTVPFVVVTEI
jgi:hypothetical protein